MPFMNDLVFDTALGVITSGANRLDFRRVLVLLVEVL